MTAPLKGTFFAFRRRARGGVILGATATHVLLMLASAIGLFALYGGVASVVMAGGIRDGAMSPLRAMAALVAPSFVYAIIMASYEAALLRWMIRGETDGLAGFSLGADTWRVYAGYWLWFLVSGAVAVLTGIFAGYVLALLHVPQSAAESWWLGYIYYGVWILVLTPLALRTCAGNAASVARRKFSYFEGWRVSRGRGLALVGSFLILWLIWGVLALAFSVAVAALISLIFPDAASAPEGRTNPLVALSFAVGIFLANVAMTFLSAGLNARAVLAAIEEGKLTGMTPDLANVFD